MSAAPRAPRAPGATGLAAAAAAAVPSASAAAAAAGAPAGAPAQQPFPLLSLPPDLITRILQRARHRDRPALRGVCRAFRAQLPPTRLAVRARARARARRDAPSRAA